MKKLLEDKIRQLIGTTPKPRQQKIALVLSGGGARAAYQAGVLKYIADAFDGCNFTIMKGVSAGAINVGQLANHPGTFREAAQSIVDGWRALTTEQVFISESTFNFFRRLMLNGGGDSQEERITSSMAHQRGLVDPSPLRAYLEAKLPTSNAGRLEGITRKLDAGKLRGVAVTATNYTTGQTTTFVQGCEIARWVRPNRIGITTHLTVDHIMASAALPLIFPAVQIDGAWYGDGGIRLTAPLSPVINMGADRILAISTRYQRTRAEADQRLIEGYPPAAQIIGILMNAIFLDVLDQDAWHLQRINELIEALPERRRFGLRPIKLLMIRPSVDIGKLAGGMRPTLSGALRLFTMGIGAGETKSPDWLSMLLFDPDYMGRLIEVGYDDAAHQHDEIAAFLDEAGGGV